MCTAISLNAGDHYFGRNLDLEYRYDERVVIMPRRFPLAFRRLPALDRHYAMIGMATPIDGYPLYYEATNEFGLSAAGLNFPDNAVYHPLNGEKENVAPFEFIPWLLAQCKSVSEARALLARANIAQIPFSPDLPPSPLHWLVADRDSAITVESVAEGLKIYDNPIGVLANNPPFDYHMTNLSNYMALSSHAPENTFAPGLDLPAYSRGMGALGLPGDCSSVSRFVRAAFTKAHSACGGSEEARVSQFFHILSSVRHVRGSVMVNGKPEITLYSSCCNTDKGVYYYTTYENSRICAVDMHRTNLDADELSLYPLKEKQDILQQN